MYFNIIHMISFCKKYKWESVFDVNKQKIWIISWIILDLNNQKLVWFIYKKSFLNYDFFIFDDDFILNKKIIITKTNNEIKSNYYDIIWKQVKNKELKNLGVVYDVEFDKFFNLKSFLVDWWYSISNIDYSSNNLKNILKKDFRKFTFKNIIKILEEYIIVEDKNYLKENKKTLENISKIFINIPKPSYNINLNKYE